MTIYEGTNKFYQNIMNQCADIFIKKAKDYGTAWRVLRPITISDQIFIKLQRINNILINKNQKINDTPIDEYIGVINYSIIGLIQLELNETKVETLALDFIKEKYTEKFNRAFELMKLKNYDYGEAWRSLSEESFIDLMLMKIYRIKQIINNDGKTLISEGLDANYLDIINYSVFCLISKYAVHEE